jgi:hypothetical protein
MTTRPGSRGWLGRVAGLGAGAAIVTVVAFPPLPAAAEITHHVVASADGARVTFTAKDFLLIEDLADVGVASAQADTHSTSGSRGFAGNPYPGDAVMTTPDLVSGLLQQQTGVEVEVPNYPLTVSSSSWGDKESKLEQPGYSLSSVSSEFANRSQATAGMTAEQGRAGQLVALAKTSANPRTGVAEAAALSDVQGITVNEILQFGRVRSSATVQIDAKGTVRSTSDLALADTRVAGHRVAITPKGIQADDQAVSAPTSEQLAEALKQAGVTVRYLAPERTKTGVVSAGVEVTATQADPTGSSATFVARYVLGRASAQAPDGAQHFDDATPSAIGPVPAAGLGKAEPIGESGPAPGVSGPAAGPGGIPAPAEAPPAPRAAGPDPSGQAVALRGWPTDVGATGIYLTVVFVALAMFVGGTLVRLLGVRTQWMS